MLRTTGRLDGSFIVTAALPALDLGFRGLLATFTASSAAVNSAFRSNALQSRICSEAATHITQNSSGTEQPYKAQPDNNDNNAVTPSFEDLGSGVLVNAFTNTLRLLSSTRTTANPPVKVAGTVKPGQEANYEMLLPPLAWLSADASTSSTAPIATQPETLQSVSAMNSKEARDKIVRKVVKQWLDSGVLHQRGFEIRLSAQPPPVTIPGGATYRSHVGKAELKTAATAAWTGPMHLITNQQDAQRAVEAILKQCTAASHPCEAVVGLDVEFQPLYIPGAGQQPPALVQVATAEDVYLFQVLAWLPSKRVFETNRTAVASALAVLQPLMEAERVYKVGVGVTEDAALIEQFSPKIQCKGFVDMGEVAQEALFKRHSLQALSLLLLGHSICKKQQRSRWARLNLSEAQLKYAATDAWVSREVALALAPLWLPQRRTAPVDAIAHSSPTAGAAHAA